MERKDIAAKVWEENHPIISQAWRQQFDRLTPFFAYLLEIRNVIYTTNPDRAAE